jgi:hypothetical protein
VKYWQNVRLKKIKLSVTVHIPVVKKEYVVIALDHIYLMENFLVVFFQMILKELMIDPLIISSKFIKKKN